MISRRNSNRQVLFTVAALLAFAILYSTGGWAQSTQGKNVVLYRLNLNHHIFCLP